MPVKCILMDTLISHVHCVDYNYPRGAVVWHVGLMKAGKRITQVESEDTWHTVISLDCMYRISRRDGVVFALMVETAEAVSRRIILKCK